MANLPNRRVGGWNPANQMAEWFHAGIPLLSSLLPINNLSATNTIGLVPQRDELRLRIRALSFLPLHTQERRRQPIRQGRPLLVALFRASRPVNNELGPSSNCFTYHKAFSPFIFLTAYAQPPALPGADIGAVGSQHTQKSITRPTPYTSEKMLAKATE